MQAIKFAAEKGFFDEDVAAKFNTQSEGKLGVLFGGRPETLVAIQAIRDSPIIGHGSFAVDQRYLELKQDIQYEYGYTDIDTPEDIENPTIPTHSHLTMAWVESGIFGGLFWMYILVLAIRAIFRIALLRPNLCSPLLLPPDQFCVGYPLFSVRQRESHLGGISHPHELQCVEHPDSRFHLSPYSTTGSRSPPAPP